MEHDADVLEYYDQPPPLKLQYQSANGRRLGVIHTPDFFLIRSAKGGWEEWKTEEDLIRLAEHNPNRYRRDEHSGWRCPPGEAQAHALGLYYRVRSSREIDWVFQRNVQFLEDYFRAGSPAVDLGVRETTLALVSANPGITLSELFHTAEGLRTRDDIYMLIASGIIRIDMSAAPLVESQQVKLFAGSDYPASCQEEPGQQRDASSSEVCLTETPSEGLSNAGPDQMAEANRRLEIVLDYQASRVLPEGVSARTVRDWIQRYRRAEATQGNGYLGLLPRFHDRGNRTPKLPKSTLALINQFIENDYETLKQKPRLHVYGSLVRACESCGTPAPSYKTFCQAVNERPRYEQVLKRKGRRAAYRLEPGYWELTLTTPRHGDRPFHICHIDHTELDVELVCSSTGRNLGRPWLTVMTDAFSRRLPALVLAFDPPSYRTCMMVLRECVRRHGRLPQITVVDGGKEFESLYFETLLARYECTKKTRPPAQARFGSVCERIFGTTNTQLIYNLLGNTQLTKEIRVVTASVDPKVHAVWTLGRLYDRLCEWAYELYDTTVHPALGQSPRDCFVDGMARTGFRNHRAIQYEDEFRMMTFPTTAKGTALVSPGKGVKINHLFYWSSAFRDPDIEQTQVPIRYDPYDAGTAYAYVGNRWVTCCSEQYAVFRGRSEHEMMLATAELRKRLRYGSCKTQLTARKLADFVASIEAEESLLLQRLRDAEARHLQPVVEGGQVVHKESAPSENSAQPGPSVEPIMMPIVLASSQPEVFEEY
jgi:transposase InsO family protein